MKKVIGTCSLCGGAVVSDEVGEFPIPECESCGATKRFPYGPVIDMEPPEKDRDADNISLGTWERIIKIGGVLNKPEICTCRRCSGACFCTGKCKDPHCPVHGRQL